MNRQASALIVDLLTSGHAVRFRARGHSMYPLIRSDDYLHVEPVPAAEVVRGDVVLARADRGLTAHRVLHVQRDARGELVLTTRGDNAGAEDALVPATQLLGRVTRAERAGRLYRVRREFVHVRRLVERLLLRFRTAVAKPPL